MGGTKIENEKTIEGVKEVRILYDDVLGYIEGDKFAGSKEEYEVFKDVFPDNEVISLEICLIVESSCQGISSSYYPLNGVEESSVAEKIEDGVQDGDIVMGVEFVKPDASPETSSDAILVKGDSDVPEETCGAGVLTNQPQFENDVPEETCGVGVLTNQPQSENDVPDETCGEGVLTNKPQSENDVPEETCGEGVLTNQPQSENDVPEETCRAGVLTNQPQSENGLLNLEAVDAASKRAIIRDLPTRLQSQAHSLLVDGGWKIDPRKRSDRTKVALYYIAPEGFPYRALSQAWKAWGKRLLAEAPGLEKDVEEREWADIEVFWGDLAEALLYIEKETYDTENSLSLLQRWKILDPYMAVVWIDKRISALRQGTVVRTLRSETVIVRGRKNTTQADKGVDKVDRSLAKPLSLSCDILCQSMIPSAETDYKSKESDKAFDQQELSIQDVHKRQKKSSHGQAEWNPTSWGEVQKRSVTSLARSIGKGLSSLGLSDSMSPKGSAFQQQRSTKLSSKSNSVHRGLCSTVASPTDNLIPREFVHLDSRTLTLYGPKTLGFRIKESEVSDSVQHIQVSDSKEKVLGDKFARGVMPDAKEGANLPTEVQFVADQSLIKEPTFSKDTDHLHNLPCSNDQDFSAVSQIVANMVEKFAGTDASKPELEQASAAKAVTSSTKRAHKKSKRISEIEASVVNAKCIEVEVHDGTNEGLFPDGIIDPFDIQFPEEVETTHMWQSRPEHPVHTEYHRKQKDKFDKASSAVQVQFPIVAEDSLMTKKLGNSIMKVGIQSGKDKKSNLNLPFEDEPGGTLLNEENAQEDPPQYKGPPKRKISQQNKRQRPKKVPRHHMVSKESLSVLDDVDTHMESQIGGSDKVLVQAIGCAPESQNTKKVVKSGKMDVSMENKRKRPRKCHIDDDDLLISVILQVKGYYPRAKRLTSKKGPYLSKALRKLKNKKESCKLLLRTPEKGIQLSRDSRRFILGKKTILCWLIEMGTVSLKDVLQFRNPKNSEVIKCGRITSDGILCRCCSNILSVSEFKAHAGVKLQKSSLNLFLKSGTPYTLCQFQAWSVEYQARKGNLRVTGTEESDENDEFCGICGDGGELICCDNCPSTYHQACLTSQDLPEDSWYCSYCICQFCRDPVNMTEASSSLIGSVCSQCEHKYHDTCIKGKITCLQVGSETCFCGESCREVYFGLRSRVGMLNSIGDGFTWTLLRCNHSAQKLSPQKIAAMVECNTKLAVALTIMEECFLPMVDARTGIDMIPHALYNWGSKFARLNYQGFYTAILEKDDKLLSVASIRLHGVSVAEMPLIATCIDNRREGMCRRLINAVEKMLISFKVEMLVVSAIPNLVETWTSGFGFKPIGPDDEQQLKNVNLMLFPGTSLLKKNLCEVVAEEQSPLHRSSSVNTGRDTDSYSREDQSKISHGVGEKCIAKTGQKFSENVRIGMDTESLLPSKLVDSQQSNILPSYGNPALTNRKNEHLDIYNVESLDEHMRTLNNPGINNGLPNVTRPVAAIDLSHKFSLLSEDTGVGPANKEKSASTGGDGVKENGTLEQKEMTDGYFSDEQTADGPFCVVSNLNKTILEELDLGKVLVDRSIVSQDEVCDSVLRHPVTTGLTPGNVEA